MLTKLSSVFALLLIAVGMLAQPAPVVPTYSVSDTKSLSGAGETLTLQQPSAPTVRAIPQWLSVYCSVACTVTPTRDGTAATTTAGTVVPLSQSNPTTGMSVFTASNAGSGTAISQAFNIPAGSTVPFNLSGMVLDKVAGRNYNFVISSITGTAQITLSWQESSF